jgi:hypothetical protein
MKLTLMTMSPDVVLISGIVYRPAFVHSTEKVHTISPFLFFQYYYDITNWFSIAFDLYSKYDFYQNKTTSIYYIPDENSDDFEYTI